MSEYWKSTPKFWCRYCKLYVKDTKFEKQQHDATPRHQSNIQRSLKTIHKEKERKERDSDRAKAEIARVTGIVSGNGAGSASTTSQQPWGRKPDASTPAPLAAKSTAEDRMRQARQLAAMGGAVPEEFRREMAAPGQWQTLSVTPLAKLEDDAQIKDEDGVDSKAVGIRKRKVDDLDADESEALAMLSKRKAWGKTLKTFPGASDPIGGAGEDVDALLSGVRIFRKVEPREGVEAANIVQDSDLMAAEPKETPLIKREASDSGADGITGRVEASADALAVKGEDDRSIEQNLPAAPLFKKRGRPKAAQQT